MLPSSKFVMSIPSVLQSFLNSIFLHPSFNMPYSFLFCGFFLFQSSSSERANSRRGGGVRMSFRSFVVSLLFSRIAPPVPVHYGTLSAVTNNHEPDNGSSCPPSLRSVTPGNIYTPRNSSTSRCIACAIPRWLNLASSKLRGREVRTRRVSTCFEGYALPRTCPAVRRRHIRVDLRT